MFYFSGKAPIALSVLLVISVFPISISQAAQTGNSPTPREIVTLNPGEIMIHWTAPGDDGESGRAAGYDVRCRPASYGPIDTEEDWNQATLCSGEPEPSLAGQRDSMLITGLDPASSYYLCVKTYDEVNNVSVMSNSPFLTAAGPPTYDFITGDVNNSGRVDGIDLIMLVNFLKGRIMIPDPVIRADVNGTCTVDGRDAICLLNYFRGGSELIETECGLDPTSAPTIADQSGTEQ